MPIPFSDKAKIPPGKIAEYLLNRHHPVGGPKAVWFLGLGYRAESPGDLAGDLVDLVQRSDGFTIHFDRFGVKYLVQGEINAPSGRRVNVVTIWIMETGSEVPRLVTAYPARS
ncbi:MAG: DUF6883 domain-containing protein [Gemmataceae bacterium]